MSLAGLDTPTVAEAHQAAQAEATGWFLVKYISRDTVDLLKRGVGGVSEVRGAVEQYEEKSPLYGLVQYRRKKIILKYVPEGTSRLLQVRLTVQFQSVLDSFNPHDTVFSFAAASELTDSALALCTMLLPASGSSTTSNSSLRRRRLNEISEDGEETSSVAPRRAGTQPDIVEDVVSNDYYGKKVPVKDADGLPPTASLAKALLAKRRDDAAAASVAVAAPVQTIVPPTIFPFIESPPPPRLDSLPFNHSKSTSIHSTGPVVIADKALPATPNPLTSHPSGSGGGAPQVAIPDFGPPSLPTLAADTTRPSECSHTRQLSAAESDSISQWSNNVVAYAPVKPKKKKLGPRPHAEPVTRPRTSGASGTSDATLRSRPVANLPSSIRISNRNLGPPPASSLPPRPGSQQSTRSVPGRFPYTSHTAILPPLPSPTHIASLYRPESRPTISRPPSVNTEASSAATPEKLRLMKALQIRKRNMLVAQRVSYSTQTTASSHGRSDSMGSTNTSRDHFSSVSTVKSDAHEPLANIDEVSKLEEPSTTGSPTTTTNASGDPSTKASSFTSGEEPGHERLSKSSGTSSSITPKAAPEAETARHSPQSAHSPPLIEISQRISVPPTPVELVKPMESFPSNSRPVPGDSKTVTSNEVSTERAERQSNRKSEWEASNQDEQETIDLVTPRKVAVGSPTASQGSLLSPASIIDRARPRRRGSPDPFGRVSDTDVSEASDDSFMEELRNAPVQKATPISVARTLVNPIVSKTPVSERPKDIPRIVSTPLPQVQTVSPTATSPEKARTDSIRSASTALPQWPSEQSLVPLTKKSTLGHGISKRIKALEVLSTREATSPPRHHVVSEAPSSRSAFTTFMKRSSLLMNQPNASTDTSPPKKLPESTPIEAEEGAQSLPWVHRQGSTTQVFAPSQKGQTVSVTARIIRDGQGERPMLNGESGDNTLHRSPLTIEHDRHHENGSRPSTNRGLNMSSIEASAISPRSSRGDKGRVSFSSHRSSSQSRAPYSESTSKLSISSSHRKHLTKSTSDNASFTEEKTKSSRAARLMKRMTNLTSSSRKSSKSQIASPPGERGRDQLHPDTIDEHSEMGSRASTADSLLHVVDIGDVNVQFPETMLWKRRFMRIDDQGYLIFSPPTNDANVKGLSRKYHLGDFHMPALPDLEREQMSWSIVLDLKNGGCVQCACENRQVQQQVLSMLVDAHSAYHQLYGQ